MVQAALALRLPASPQLTPPPAVVQVLQALLAFALLPLVDSMEVAAISLEDPVSLDLSGRSLLQKSWWNSPARRATPDLQEPQVQPQ